MTNIANQIWYIPEIQVFQNIRSLRVYRLAAYLEAEVGPGYNSLTVIRLKTKIYEKHISTKLE